MNISQHQEIVKNRPPFLSLQLQKKMSAGTPGALFAQQNQPIFSEHQLINISLIKKTSVLCGTGYFLCKHTG